jgi:putative protease
MKAPELLAPAGSPEALDAAVGEGADAVYLGLKNFNARLRSANFAYSQFEGALRSLHRMGRKLYVTVNTVFEQREADRVYQLLKYLANTGPDGIIIQDFGVAAMAGEHFPSLKLLASTQMNVASAKGVNFLSRRGFSRAILARELSLGEIRALRSRTNLELEVFVHGALCVSASGLCLFSSFLGGKSANRGLCTQACRRFYRPGNGGPARRPPREEPGGESSGGYYFSPSDLQLLERIPDLAAAGVNSFKIEGRMKSAGYVGTAVAAYRRVIDALSGDEGAVRGAVEEGRRILLNDFARSKTVFYFDEGPEGEGGAGSRVSGWLDPAQGGGTGIFLGKILRLKGAGEERRALLPPGPVLPSPGDSLRVHRADDSDRRPHKLLSAAPAEGEGGVWVSVPEGFEAGDAVYLIQTRAMGKRYPPVIPPRIDGFKRVPGREKAPLPELSLPKRPGARGRRGKGDDAYGDSLYPAGIYAAVSRIEDLYILQSVRPEKVILDYTPGIAARLLGQGPLPFGPGEIVISLDPYFPQAREDPLGEDLRALVEGGYRRYMLNNLGHISLLKNAGAPCSLIAGPYLYLFNRWAAAFLAAGGLSSFVSPLENNRQNLERTVEPDRRSLCFITVFSWPALFRIRADLGGAYDFGAFSGSREEQFRLVSGPQGSRVYPEAPFSIVDKVPFLRAAGFGRFILDFSGQPLKKALYKEVMGAVKNAAPLPGTVRFNWKNGFFHNEEPAPSGPKPLPPGE